MNTTSTRRGVRDLGPRNLHLSTGNTSEENNRPFGTVALDTAHRKVRVIWGFGRVLVIGWDRYR